MKISFICPYWGQEHLPIDEFVARAMEAGFDGVEVNIPIDNRFCVSLAEAVKSSGACLVAQQYLHPCSESFDQYRIKMKNSLMHLAAQNPLFINSHTGKDYYSFDENSILINDCNDVSEKMGLRVFHETHRGRFSYHASSLLPYIRKFESIEFTADFSHFCVVSESLLEDQEHILDEIIPHCSYIHARVGYSQSAQVNHPFAPEWQTTLNRFLLFWHSIIEVAKLKGEKTFFVCPEFGPVPYMPTLPYTQQPVSNHWDINVWMMKYLKDTLNNIKTNNMELLRDLSNYHHLISDMFTTPASENEWEKYRLSEEQVAFFEENGYLSGIKLLDEDQVEQLNKELVIVMDPKHPNHDLLYEFHSNESEDPDRVIFHSLGHWRMTPGFHDILWNPAFVMAACQLLGQKSIRFWHDQLFCKPAKHGGVVAWHQDYSYWTRTAPMQHLTAWVGLDDATVENGCLQYIPGSHRWGLLNKPVLTGEMDGIKAFLNEDQISELKNPIPIEMKKGYATFHHPLLVHGSFENFSERPRRAFVLNVFADGTYSETDQEILRGVPIIKSGNKMEGKFFPLLR